MDELLEKVKAFSLKTAKNPNRFRNSVHVDTTNKNFNNVTAKTNSANKDLATVSDALKHGKDGKGIKQGIDKVGVTTQVDVASTEDTPAKIKTKKLFKGSEPMEKMNFSQNGQWELESLEKAAAPVGAQSFHVYDNSGPGGTIGSKVTSERLTHAGIKEHASFKSMHDDDFGKMSAKFKDAGFYLKH